MGENDADESPLSIADVAALEAFVIPHYLSPFGRLVVNAIARSDEAQIVHFDCRTGFPDIEVVEKLNGAHLYGCDRSSFAIAIARAKAAALPGGVFHYEPSSGQQAVYSDAAFSHAFTIHPRMKSAARNRAISECARLLAPGGEGLVALPIRGSFKEAFDLVREFALRHEELELSARLEAPETCGPTADQLIGEFEASGFEFVRVDQQQFAMKFESGRAFIDDAAMRLCVLPELEAPLRGGDAGRLRQYLCTAIDRYWSHSAFELTISAAVAVGRRM